MIMLRILVAGIVVSGCALVVGLGASCGGKVVFEEGAAGGAGGTTSSTTGGNTTSGVGAGSGQTTSSSSSSTSSSSSSSVSTSSSSSTGGGGMVACGSGLAPSPQCDDCVQIALNGVCFAVTEQCINDDACLQFSECTGGCFGDEDCCLDCSLVEPEGAKLFGELVDCVVCQECNAICAGFFPGFSTCL